MFKNLSPSTRGVIHEVGRVALCVAGVVAVTEVVLWGLSRAIGADRA